MTTFVRATTVRYCKIADRKGCSLAQLSLAWLIAQPQTNAIVGARNSEQARANSQAANVQLSAEDFTEIDAISRSVNEPLDDSPVMWDF